MGKEYSWHPITDEMREYREGIYHKHKDFPPNGEDVWVTYNGDGTPVVLKLYLKMNKESDGNGFACYWYDSTFRDVMFTSIKDKNVKAWMGIYEPAPYEEKKNGMESCR